MLESVLMTSIQKKRQIFYICSYIVISILSVLALVVNIKTLPIIEARQKCVVETQKLEEENHQLELKMLSGMGYPHIESIAKDKLNMVIPETIYYIDAQ